MADEAVSADEAKMVADLIGAFREMIAGLDEECFDADGEFDGGEQGKAFRRVVRRALTSLLEEYGA